MLKHSNNIGILEYWNCFMRCSLSNIFVASAKLHPKEKMATHVRIIKEKALKEIDAAQSKDSLLVRILNNK